MMLEDLLAGAWGVRSFDLLDIGIGDVRSGYDLQRIHDGGAREGFKEVGRSSGEYGDGNL